MKRSVLLLLLLLMCGIGQLSAETKKDNRRVLFRNISISAGLSQSTVFAITQDTIGYMWFGTQDGLNRYDGTDFFVYKNDVRDSASIASNYIRKLYIDRKGTLWIGGDKGVSRYSLKHDSFVNHILVKGNTNENITDILEDESGKLWVASDMGKVFLYDKENNRFGEIKFRLQGTHIDNINTLYSIGEKLLLGTDTGLYIMDKASYSVSKKGLIDDSPIIRKIVVDDAGRYWVGTEGHGLLLVDKDLKLLKRYGHKKGVVNTLSNDNIRSLAFDNEGRLWIGTFVGLSILDVQTETFSNYYEEFSRPYALSQNSVRSLHCDRQGGMWLGTFFGGVDYHHPADIKFDLLNQNGGSFSLSDNVVSSMIEDQKGNIWIATNDKGLNYWNRKNNKISNYSHDELKPQSLSSNNVKSLVVLGDNKLLAGTHKSGLNYLDGKTGRNRIFKHSGALGSIADNSVYALLKDHKSRIWVGTWKGLDLFDPDNGMFKHHLVDSKGRHLTSEQITFLYEDSRARIWVGTSNGLNIFYPERNVFESFLHIENDSTSLIHNKINCITEDSKGRIWIGTGRGLSVFDEINRGFVNYDSQDGLTNDVVFGILEDEQGYLWISTNGGLFRFKQKDRLFQLYDMDNGIQSRQFNNYSFCKTSDGCFMFGGINGITMFYPEDIRETPFNDHVILRNLRVFYKRVLPDDETGILTKPIGRTPKIRLKSDQNMFAFNFSAINFIGAKKIKYLRKLEGYDKEWRRGSGTQSATYSNLPSGTYTFKVKAISSDGVESENVTSIDVEVLRPWFLTNWAILSYLILIALIGYISMRLLKERIKTQNELRVERLEKKKLTEINQMKLEFFTNISHEFRTPLTLILSPLQKVRERYVGDEWLNKQNNLIYKNTQRLLSLIDQLMDFRKSELGSIKLKASKGELVSFVNEIYLSFAEVASQNNIVYTFDARQDKIDLVFDNSYMEKIIFNLLSNAFKFTPSGGSIGIMLSQTDKNAIIEVSDSGKGIPADKQSLIFERFYRIDEGMSKRGTGIGLALTKRLVDLHHGSIEVESEEGKGARFIINFPLSEIEYAEDELVVEQLQTTDKQEPIVSVYQEEEVLVDEDENGEQDSLLLVEDNPDIISYLKENLRDQYKIYTASNGEEGLEVVGKHQPTLIISDVMMPVMDGIKFCKKIKQNIKTCHIPVILLTAKTSVEDQIEGLGTGADDYVSKPFMMNLLEAKISNIIKTRKRLKQYYSSTLDIEPTKIALNTLDEELLAKAVKIVEDHLEDADFSVDLFAREMGMSRSNLHLKLKGVTGESATDFIKKIRFGKAVKLLEENRYSIAEISYMVGFNSPSYFSTSFKKYFGHLPTEHIQRK
ncbi:hybrid sensor histidine kinase/response regulator [Puteibacter caeruleilacunae]|nr:hybrid sensor histidine kinase/response regulator [Puteibacter caeruleilacunae]